MRVFAILLSSLLLAACATTATPESEQRTVPSERIFIKSKDVSPNTAKIVVVRDQGATQSMIYFHLYIDGKKAASLNPGEKAEFNLEAGEHFLKVIPTDPFGAGAGYSIDQNLQPGRTYYYRLLTDAYTPPRIQRER